MKPFDEIVRGLDGRIGRDESAPRFRCEECRDRGWVVIPDGGNGLGRQCDCKGKRSVEEKLISAGMTDASLLNASWQNLSGGEKYRQALAEFPDPKSCVVLMGPTGTGKTHMAVAVLRDALEDGKTCRFLEGRELIAKGREAIGRGYPAEAVIGGLDRCRLVVLSEAFADRSTDFADELLSNFIRHRFRHRLPLVIDTNLTEPELTRMEPRVASRILGGDALAFDFTGRPDFRKTLIPFQRRTQ